MQCEIILLFGGREIGAARQHRVVREVHMNDNVVIFPNVGIGGQQLTINEVMLVAPPGTTDLVRTFPLKQLVGMPAGAAGYSHRGGRDIRLVLNLEMEAVTLSDRPPEEGDEAVDASGANNGETPS